MNNNCPEFYTGQISIINPSNKEEYFFDNAVIMLSATHIAICKKDEMDEILSEFSDHPEVVMGIIRCVMKNWDPSSSGERHLIDKKKIPVMQEKVHRFSNSHLWRIN